MNPRLRASLFVLLLFLAAWLPRVWALDAFVTPDERKWLARSANFAYAVSHGDLAQTFQREHPGVTVMWAGALGLLQEFPDYAEKAPGYFAWDTEQIESWLADATMLEPLGLLTAGRWWVVLGVALAIALGFLPLRRLLGEWPAVFASLWLAWDPFAVALSRQLHPDGFVSTLTFLALLLFLAWLYGARRWGTLALSSFVMGLAWLTKTPAIFLAPTGALLLLWEWGRSRRTPGATGPVRALGELVLWGALATLVFVALWPAMWLDPLGTLLRMGSEMSEYVERHTNINYFLGRPVDDPGLLFYPVAWLFRTTPAVIVGLVAAALFAARRQGVMAEMRVRRTAVALLLFALVFVAGMSVGAKKFDRYILPAFLALDVIAALGWVALGQWVAERMGIRRALAVTATAGLVLGHALLTAMHAPYYLTYFNPLTGGSATAPGVLWVGWGEGLDEAARWLNTQPNARESRTAAFYYDGPFSYYYDGAASNLGYGSPLFWLGIDYAVTYINQVQRQVPAPETIAYFEGREAVHTVRFRGLDLAKVYDLRGAPLPDFLDIAKENGVDFGGAIRLLAYEFSQIAAQPGDTVQATLFLQGLAPMPTNYNVLLRLVAADGSELWRDEGWPWGAPTSDWPAREVRPDGHTVVVPPDAAPGLYRYLVSFYDPATLELLPLTEVESGAPLPQSEQAIALLQVGTPRSAIPLDTEFGGLLSLDDASINGRPRAGESANLRLVWGSVARTGTAYTVFAHVFGPDGARVAQMDRPPLDGFAATNLLLPGQQVEERLSIPLPDGLSAGAYSVRVGLYSGETRLPVSVDGAPAGDSVVAATFTLP